MDHHQSEIDELLGNPYFRDWVFRPTTRSDRDWEAYKTDNPHKLEVIQAARETLLLIQQNTEMDFPDEDAISRMFHHIQINKEPKRAIYRLSIFRWVAAACMGIIAVAFWYGYSSSGTGEVKEVSYQNLIKESACELREYVNNTAVAAQVILSDGSEVRLEPGSKISYSASFGNKNLREVYLDGTAFFNVVKNAESPFIVYANELITKVLGTSFWILKSDDRSELLVEVITGKVAVSTQNNIHIKTTEPLSEEGQILVTPNQQLLFSRKTVTIHKSLVTRPVIVHKPVLADELEFDDVAASKVFSAIEKAYGVEIEYDSTRLGTCLVTASLTGESLYETVGAICDAINARYHITGTKIIIEGYGCS